MTFNLGAVLLMGQILFYCSQENPDVDLCTLAENGNLAEIKALISNKDDLFTLLDSLQCSPFHYAAQNGHLDLVRYFVEIGIPVDIENAEGLTPIQSAVGMGRYSVVKYLIDKGANTSIVKAITEETLLHRASGNNQDLWVSPPLHHPDSIDFLKTVKYLVQNGAQINATDWRGDSPLHLASFVGNEPIVRFLVEHNANVNAINNRNQTPLYDALFSGRSLDVAKYLVDNGADVNNKEHSGQTVAFWTARRGSFESIKFLTDQGIRINETDTSGRTPLFYAVFGQNIQVVNHLVQEGAFVDIKDNKGATPLHFAVSGYSVNLSIAQFLIKNGADVHSIDEKGDTPLHYASNSYPDGEGGTSGGNIEVMALLINNGAKVNSLNNMGKTPADNATGKAKEYLIAINNKNK